MKKEKVIKIRVLRGEKKLLEELKKVTEWNASQIIREALKSYAIGKGIVLQ